ncbi:AI-2E family transporter [Paracoccus saliphilus]|uniref:Predicted PurR-regulated permease PerM n=2 Tax=Paracoccus saliphilus TaxID=405559 RepID=A0AA46A561_9RHOB|nr:AI-2E family transporter [Paracoccus saliphilus]SIS75201.1 Predicted PurR-regulated permease PerM [Paracoccus saliphilus]
MDHSSERVLRERLQTGFLGIIAFGLILFMLVQARFILISLAIAIILFSLTTDAIFAICSRLKVPNWLGTMLALIGIVLGVLWVSTTVVAQINQVVQTAVVYVEQAQAALPTLTQWLGPDVQDRLLTAISNFNITGWIRSLAGQATGVLQGSVLVILFVGFMFAEQVWFPLKVERLTGDPQKALQVRRIISSIMHRVNRYLVVKTAVSGVTSVAVWLIFTLADVGLAGPIALLTFILNFIPSVGSIIATAIAAVLAFVLSGDTTVTIIIAAACSLVQFTIGNVLDPMLLGQTLRLSSFGIILSLAFWGAVWGIPGMFLAVPIMVALMIVCAHIPWLRPVAVLLSREGLPDDGSSDEDDEANPPTLAA